jgi:hypothetical protein
MNIRSVRSLRYLALGVAVFAFAAGAGAGAWLLPPAPASAIGTSVQMLSGGNSLTGTNTRFTAPGLANQYTSDFPDVGFGENGAQLRMPAGVMRKLRVRLAVQTIPTSGSLTLTVRKNAADTTLTCTIAAAAMTSQVTNCQETATSVSFNTGDRLAVVIANDFPDSGFMTYTYTLEYD